ncbi:AMIN domain-containing protein [Egbenema bharatensis]|uniref:AMIN domain-containing protein n=1 Tax=Egbenema bharatensis TaxID=3463334 RepID=UPI003A89813D
MPSILGAIGVLCLTSPVEAARLVRWRFSPGENRLTITTDEGIQPRVQLIANPTRLVVDLPGTAFGRPQVEQAVGGGIRAVRVGQYDDATTRIVIELTPGYTLDPEQVRVRGTTASQWTVDLPEPQPGEPAIAEISDSQTADRAEVEVSAPEDLPTFSPIEAATQIEDLRLTRDGLFIRTRGDTPEIDQNYNRRRRRLTIEIENAAFAPEVVRRELELSEYGIERIELVQADVREGNPPTANVILHFAPNVERWQVDVSGFGGIVLIPRESRLLADVQSPRSLTAGTTTVSAPPLPVPDSTIPVPMPDRRPRFRLPCRPYLMFPTTESPLRSIQVMVAAIRGPSELGDCVNRT